MSNITNFLSDVTNVKDKLGTVLTDTVSKKLGGVSGVFDSVFNRSKNVKKNADGIKKETTSATTSKTENNDWRVSLSVPSIYFHLSSSTSSEQSLLSPLNGKMIFPFTPSILMTHSAHYDPMQPTHSNYAFQTYQYSSVEAITITGDFFVENSDDARHWIATLHYLRSITKMFYGESTNAGSPPPVVKLNGYGNYVFNDVPVVIQSFNVELPSDVNYIKADLILNDDDVNNPTPQTTWVPTQSSITVTVQPTYSRSNVAGFSLNDFVSGNYITNGKGFI